MRNSEEPKIKEFKEIKKNLRKESKRLKTEITGIDSGQEKRKKVQQKTESWQKEINKNLKWE